MSLLDQQELLAKLLTEPKSINEFEAVDELKPFYESLKSSEIMRFKESLLRKRFRGVSSIFPLTAKILKGELFELFSLYASSYRPDGVDRYIKDSYKFSDFLLQRLKDFPHAVLKLETVFLMHNQQSKKKSLFYLNWSSKAIKGLDESSKRRTLYIKTTNSLIEVNTSGIKRL